MVKLISMASLFTLKCENPMYKQKFVSAIFTTSIKLDSIKLQIILIIMR